MKSGGSGALLWWVIPRMLAGMPMPYIHIERRMAGGGSLNDFDDELPLIYSEGIRAVVSLLNISGDAPIYESAGFSFLCIPVPDGGAPTLEQAKDFVHFVRVQHALQRSVAVHCQAGVGRTGTMLAAYFIAEGESATGAIQKVRAVEKFAVETRSQVQFLEKFKEAL
jgi:atypical dual specificity phosphatase